MAKSGWVAAIVLAMLPLSGCTAPVAIEAGWQLDPVTAVVWRQLNATEVDQLHRFYVYAAWATRIDAAGLADIGNETSFSLWTMMGESVHEIRLTLRKEEPTRHFANDGIAYNGTMRIYEGRGSAPGQANDTSIDLVHLAFPGMPVGALERPVQWSGSGQHAGMGSPGRSFELSGPTPFLDIPGPYLLVVMKKCGEDFRPGEITIDHFYGSCMRPPL